MMLFQYVIAQGPCRTSSSSSKKNNLGPIDLLQSARRTSDMHPIGTLQFTGVSLEFQSEKPSQADGFVRMACHF
jgi:hypothetical protein